MNYTGKANRYTNGVCALIKTFQQLRLIDNPSPDEIGDSIQDFLTWLGGPVAIRISGKDSTRTRAICTLLHGNEPSGTEAIFQYIKSAEAPLVDAWFIIASVDAARKEPLFTNRMMPEKRDLNRCFGGPFNDDQGKLAKSILDFVHHIKPECLIDIHNTSGSGPAFGVAIIDDKNHAALTSLFSNDLIVTDLRLGALMELSESDVPTVTIECGGVKDYSAGVIALEGLSRYLSTEHVLAQADIEYRVNIFHNPIRLELKVKAKSHGKETGCVAYQDKPDSQAIITLPAQAEKFNYGTLTPEEPIAYLSVDGFAQLSAKDHLGNEYLDVFFEEKEGQLFAKHPMKIFMATTSPFIAETDCLFYFIGC
jgi:Succinylglutamate desuccinylase / Aspartoacylase family